MEGFRVPTGGGRGGGDGSILLVQSCESRQRGRSPRKSSLRRCVILLLVSCRFVVGACRFVRRRRGQQPNLGQFWWPDRESWAAKAGVAASRRVVAGCLSKDATNSLAGHRALVRSPSCHASPHLLCFLGSAVPIFPLTTSPPPLRTRMRMTIRVFRLILAFVSSSFILISLVRAPARPTPSPPPLSDPSGRPLSDPSGRPATKQVGLRVWEAGRALAG